jgi:hypothetical protein
MSTEATASAFATAEVVACGACGASERATATYCSTCGTPLGVDGGAPAIPPGTRRLTGERLLAGYVIPAILLTLIGELLGSISIGLLPGLIAIGFALSAQARLQAGDLEGADNDAWKARITLAISGVILGVVWLAPVAARVLNFLTSL